MSLAVVGETSLIRCDFGLVPTPLTVLPDRTVTAEMMLMGNISDFMPLANVMDFVECISLTNPEVLIATIAALGVLTPMPCIPITVEPWLSEALDVTVGGPPALDETAMVLCIWTGPVMVLEPGNFTVMVP
jgi:hypothetical protein